MKIWIYGSQWLLGVVFILAGLNGLAVFFDLEPFMQTSPKAMELFQMKYLLFFEKTLELMLGIMLIGGRFMPFVLAALLPIIANICLFHLFEDRSLLPLALFLMLLESYLLFVYAVYFRALFVYKAKPFGDDHGKALEK